VTIIGVAGGETTGGLTAAWITRVSHDPPLLLVAIGHERHTWQLLEQADEFSVSLLAEGQVPEARLFGLHSRRDRDKWAEVDHVLLGRGTPALRHCSARFLCTKQGRFTAGDHDCYTGRVVEAEIVAGQPVLPLRGTDYAD
jgi:flavin reductase (DIM6/NTAB) family NADH-FMN oxidoreductase RutF